MKLRYKLLTVGFLLGFLGIQTTASYAQMGDVGRILQSSADDANILVQEYLKPFGSGFGASLNSGWTNTARPHKKFGFDLTVSTGLATVPTADKTFDITQIGLQELEVENGPSTLQTINGNRDAQTTTLAAYETINGNEEKLFEFDMPKGTGFGYVPAPEIKGAIGLIKDTEIMFRYVPQVEIGNYGTFDQFGFGAKHGINQWLPGGNLLPVDLSLMAGYTKQTVSAGFSLTGEDIRDPQTTEPYDGPSDTWDGQEIRIQTNAYTVNALVGKTLPVISVYGGVGYEASTMAIATPGNYPTIGENPDFNGGSSGEKPLIVKTMPSPIDVEIEGKNGFHALAGFRLKFAVIHLTASYKLANYSTFNAGLGISFR